MDILFLPNTNYAPLPSQLHTPLHSSLLAIRDCGTEGGLVGVGVSGDDVDLLG